MTNTSEILNNWFVSNDHKTQIKFIGYLEQNNVFMSYYANHLTVDDHLEHLVKLMSPKFKDDKISIYVNSDKWLREIRTLVKYGSFIKRLYPQASQKEVDVFIDSMKNFVESIKEKKCYHKYSDTAEDFRRIYSGKYAPQINMYTSDSLKTISNSCMRYDYQNKPGFRNQHPVEAYATGDFEIHWLEDQSGLLYARVVAFKKEPLLYKLGPIYTVANEYSNVLMDQMQEFFNENKIKFELAARSSYGWQGARLRLLNHDSVDTIVAPYVDCGPRGAVLDESGDTYTLEIDYDDDPPIEVDYDLRHNGNGVSYKLHFICAGSGKRYPSDLGSVELNNKLYSFEYAEENFFMCGVSKKWYRNDVDLIQCFGSYIHKSYKDELVMSEYSRVILHSSMSSAYKITDGEFKGDLVTYNDYIRNFLRCPMSIGIYHKEEFVRIIIDNTNSIRVYHNCALDALKITTGEKGVDVSRISFTYGNLVPEEVIKKIKSFFPTKKEKKIFILEKGLLRSKYDNVIKWITR